MRDQCEGDSLTGCPGPADAQESVTISDAVAATLLGMCLQPHHPEEPPTADEARVLFSLIGVPGRTGSAFEGTPDVEPPPEEEDGCG